MYQLYTYSTRWTVILLLLREFLWSSIYNPFIIVASIWNGNRYAYHCSDLAYINTLRTNHHLAFLLKTHGSNILYFDSRMNWSIFLIIQMRYLVLYDTRMSKKVKKAKSTWLWSDQPYCMHENIDLLKMRCSTTKCNWDVHSIIDFVAI
jgi:hypothetical protein